LQNGNEKFLNKYQNSTLRIYYVQLFALYDDNNNNNNNIYLVKLC